MFKSERIEYCAEISIIILLKFIFFYSDLPKYLKIKDFKTLLFTGFAI
jgi:hypothetical protein